MKQLPLFTDDNNDEEIPLDPHYASVRKSRISLSSEEISREKKGRSVSLSEPGTMIDFDDDKPKLELPRRWEFCLEKAREINAVNSLLQVVRTPTKALEELGYYLDTLGSSGGEGALWIFHGNAGSGKSTFLQTLENKVNTPEEDIVEVQVIRGEQVNLADRLETYKVFLKFVENRRSKDTTLILVLEDVEVGLNDQELEGLSQALKMTLRSSKPSHSRKVLVTIPVNNQRFGTRLQDVSREIGLFMRESGTSSLYVFEGPKEEEYIEIAEDLTRVLNGRPLADFGLRKDVLEKIPRKRVSIGDFIQGITAIANEQDKKVATLMRQRQSKKIVTIFAFVRPMHPVDIYSAVQLMVSDPDNNVSSRWLLDQAGASGNRWEDKTTQFAAIVNGILRVKAVEFPPHVLYQMIQMSGSRDFVEKLKNHLEDEDLNPSKPRNWTNVREAIASTNLIRILTGEQTKRPSHVGSVEPKEEDSPQTQQKKRAITKRN